MKICVPENIVLQKSTGNTFVKTVKDKVCKAFIGLTIRAKMTGGGRPLLPEILTQSDRVGANLGLCGVCASL